MVGKYCSCCSAPAAGSKWRECYSVVDLTVLTYQCDGRAANLEAGSVTTLAMTLRQHLRGLEAANRLHHEALSHLRLLKWL